MNEQSEIQTHDTISYNTSGDKLSNHRYLKSGGEHWQQRGQREQPFKPRYCWGNGGWGGESLEFKHTVPCNLPQRMSLLSCHVHVILVHLNGVTYTVTTKLCPLRTRCG